MSPAAFGLLIAGAILAAAAALVATVWWAVRAQQTGRIRRRLAEPRPIGEFEAVAGDGSVLARAAATGKALERFVDTGSESPRLLVQAGWRSGRARLIFYAFQALCPMAAGAAVLALWLFGGERLHGYLIALAAFFGVGVSLLVPRWVLRRTASQRRNRIKSEVPLLVHLLVLLFEAGLSTRQAIASLVREGRGVLPELGTELDLALRQIEAGGDAAEVLKSLGETLDVGDLTSVLGVLRQVDRYGGEVREPLLEALAVIEQRHSLDLREKVNLMSGRMTVVMVLFFFPALLFFVAGPAFASILKALSEVVHR